MIKKLLCITFIAVLIVTVLFPLAASADAPLDEIQEYKITVDMESDATADITYHIDWKVLDDSSEGPLTWVKIGIPNSYVDNIKALSSNINDIYYYDDGSDYVRIDLDRSYYANEIVTMDFSLHVSYLYMLDAQNNTCRYEFMPGWFKEIDVKSLIIMWNDKNVLESNAPGTDGDYLVWTASLAAGERYAITVIYNMDAFDTSYDTPPVKEEPPQVSFDESAYYESDYNSGNSDWVAIVFVIIALPIWFFIRVMRGGGRGGGGGGYYGGFGGHHIGGGGGCACVSSCACACGCACACACAGGGRAGCSAKNLYGAVKTEGLKRALKETR